MGLKPYLQLVRLPNVFTAAADSLAGWLLVRGTLDEPGRWLPLVLASACTYAGGIVLNDVFDIEVDRVERPDRPLPSGRVGLRFARIFGFGLMAAGVALAAVSGVTHAFPVECALVACVMLYDLGLKRSALGPELMGACRGLNLLLGLCGGARLGGSVYWIAAMAYGLFVTGITWISRSEVDGGSRKNLGLGIVLQNLAIATLIVVSLLISTADVRLGFGAVLLLAIAVFVGRKTIEAYRNIDPKLIQGSIKAAILSLVWIHVALVLAARGPIPAVAVGILWFPAAFAGRWIYST